MSFSVACLAVALAVVAVAVLLLMLLLLASVVAAVIEGACLAGARRMYLVALWGGLNHFFCVGQFCDMVTPLDIVRRFGVGFGSFGGLGFSAGTPVSLPIVPN